LEWAGCAQSSCAGHVFTNQSAELAAHAGDQTARGNKL